jgi:hypothetical protein
MGIFDDYVEGQAVWALFPLDLPLKLLALVTTHPTPRAELDVMIERVLETLRSERAHTAQALSAR